MEDVIDAAEVFRIAEQIETEGAVFYRHAADVSTNDEIKLTFSELAQWEGNHRKTFAEMREQATGNNLKLKDDEEAYKALAALNPFSDEVHPEKAVTGITTLKDALKAAILKEHETIRYYEGLKNFVADKSVIESIDQVIDEEKEHIEILTKLLG